MPIGSPLDFLTTYVTSNGIAAGPMLGGSLFVPYGMGIVFVGPTGNLWQTQLTENGDGSANLSLQQVTF